MRSPFVSLTTVVFPRVPFRSRAPPPTSPLPSSPPPRASLQRDCPILSGPELGCLSLSRGPATLSVRVELWSHTPHAILLILAALCWLLRVCAETLQAPFELAAACDPISPCCRLHACSLKPLFFSLVRRMIAMLINCVAEKTNAHSGGITSVVFSPDGTKIVSGSDDGTIKVWESGAPEPSNRPFLGLY